MRPVAIAYGRALRSQFSARMLLLSVVPLLLSLALWGGLLYAGMQPLLDRLHALFADYGLFETSGSILAMLGLGFLKTLVIPLVAMLVLLPLMIVTSLLFIGVGAMPAIARHVSRVQFPALERKEGGRPIIRNQASAFKRANMITEIEASRMRICPGRSFRRRSARRRTS